MAINAPTTAQPTRVRRRAAPRPSPRPPRRRRRGVSALGVQPHGILVAGFLTAMWGWWAWEQGAYFGTVLLPGAILFCSAAVLLALTAPAPFRLGLNPPARVALYSIVGLAGWT